MEITSLKLQLSDLLKRSEALRGYLNYPEKKLRLLEITRELEDPAVWQKQEKAQVLNKERVQLLQTLENLDTVHTQLNDANALLELAISEEDVATVESVRAEVEGLTKKIEELEFKRMFHGELDPNHAYLDVQSGSGGTEAQDWAEMLLRMYLKWGESHGFTMNVLEVSPGDVAGIKSASVEVVGDYAYGWLRTETGVHRLVRKSPFDSGNRRHTSFASVFVSPEVDEDISIEINPADLRVDTYRASGAGGQHVNRTDSAIRITHIPSGIVVQCQSDRSQHKNRSQAMKQLKARLYELELQKKNAERDALEASKSDITWGSQIRSYILDDARVKDLRTNYETRNPTAVLNGDLDAFLKASLQEGL